VNVEITLENYKEIVGPGVTEELRVLADRVKGRRMQHVNSTPVGLLTRMVPLFRELGLEVNWYVIKGDQAFFNVTKAFHNGLHGKAEEVTEDMFEIFRSTTEMNLAKSTLREM
jgi:trehalose synthase